MKLTKKIIRIKRGRTRKIKGGGKSLESIIEELKKKDKYDEWVSKGSYFTYKSRKLKLPFKYTFIDMNGNSVLGQMQSKIYRSDFEENIPIFGQIFKKDPNFVKPGKFRFVQNNNGRLITYGLASCSGLSMKIGKQKFLTHLDADTKVDPIISALLEQIDKEGESPKNIIIYAGRLNSSMTVKLAKDIIKGIGITMEHVKIENVCMFKNVII